MLKIVSTFFCNFQYPFVFRGFPHSYVVLMIFRVLLFFMSVLMPLFDVSFHNLLCQKCKTPLLDHGMLCVCIQFKNLIAHFDIR